MKRDEKVALIHLDKGDVSEAIRLLRGQLGMLNSDELYDRNGLRDTTEPWRVPEEYRKLREIALASAITILEEAQGLYLAQCVARRKDERYIKNIKDFWHLVTGKE